MTSSKVDQHQVRMMVSVCMLEAHPELRSVVRGDSKVVFSDPLNTVRADMLKKLMASDSALKKTLEFHVKRETP